MTKPFVSICIPTYNGADYIAAAIESACGQSFGDIEILIVDDSSSDETLEIAKAASARDARIRILRNVSNLGLVGNWNRCLLEARGVWIKFLFQDDILDSRCVETMIGAANENDASFVACYRNFLFADGTDSLLAQGYRDQAALISVWYEEPTKTREAFARFAVHLPPRNLVGEPTVTMFKRELVHQIGFFDANLIHLCDAEYWLRLGSAVGITMVRQTLATFRVHGSSTSSKNAAERVFRARSLDPAVILYKLLFTPEFVLLRETAAAEGVLGAREFEFWSSCHFAKEDAMRWQREGAQRPMSDWELLIALFPIFSRVPISQRARRILRGLLHRLGGGPALAAEK